jgi:hypothetical protein
MDNEWIDVDTQLPERGKDVIGMTPDGEEHEVFLCTCPHNCRTWKCSLTGYSLIPKMIKWKEKTN